MFYFITHGEGAKLVETVLGSIYPEVGNYQYSTLNVQYSIINYKKRRLIIEN